MEKILFEEATEIFEALLNEEMSDKKKKSMSSKLGGLSPRKLDGRLWGDTAAIKAAGLDVSATNSWK